MSGGLFSLWTWILLAIFCIPGLALPNRFGPRRVADVTGPALLTRLLWDATAGSTAASGSGSSGHILRSAPTDFVVDRLALTDLFIATGGASWKTPWPVDDGTLSFCAWAGVTCKEDTSVNPPVQRIVALALSGIGLSGMLPSSFGNLTWLQVIDLSYNTLTGALPDEMNNLIQLTSVLLHYNYDITGLPSNWGSVSPCRLRQLNIWLTGVTVLPETLTNCHDLAYLELYSAPLRLYPPFLPQFTKLVYLSTGYNFVSGPISHVFCNLSKSLITLFICDEEFIVDTFPSCLQSFTNLEHLWIYNIPFSPSPFPTSLCSLTRLQDIYLFNAGLIGELPSCLGTNIPSMYILDVRKNSLSGQIPLNWSAAVNLRTLYIAYEFYSRRSSLICFVLYLFVFPVFRILHVIYWVRPLAFYRYNNFSGCLPWPILLLPRLAGFDLTANSLTCIDPPSSLNVSLDNYCPLFPETSSIGFSASRLNQLLVAGNKLTVDIHFLLLCLRRFAPNVAIVNFAQNFIFGYDQIILVVVAMTLFIRHCCVHKLFLNSSIRSTSSITQVIINKTYTYSNQGLLFPNMMILNFSRNNISGSDTLTNFRIEIPSVDFSFNALPKGFDFMSTALNSMVSVTNVRGNPFAPLYTPAQYTDMITSAFPSFCDKVLQDFSVSILPRSGLQPDIDSPNLLCSYVNNAKGAAGFFASSGGMLLTNNSYLAFRHCVCLDGFAWDDVKRQCVACPPKIWCSPNVTMPLHSVPPDFYPVWNPDDLVASGYNIAACDHIPRLHNLLTIACVFDVLAKKTALQRSDYSPSVPFLFFTLAEQAQLLVKFGSILQCPFATFCQPYSFWWNQMPWMPSRSDAFSRMIPTPDSNTSLLTNPTPDTTYKCADGLDPASFFCSKCLPFYYSLGFSQPCVPCPQYYSWFVPLSSSLALLSLVFYFFNFQATSGSAVIPIVVAWIQVWVDVFK
jgi:hypothetical protein